jgi:hypothetical protein
MNLPSRLQVELLSDTTFVHGEGGNAEVDVEVDHDAEGLPAIRGWVLWVLLKESWTAMANHFGDLASAARQIFGVETNPILMPPLRIGDAVLPADLRVWVRHAVQRAEHPLTPAQVLRTLTGVRTQVAQDRVTGTVNPTAWRTSRVVLRGLRLSAPLTWLRPPEPAHLQVLALSAMGARHGGMDRHRGRGHLLFTLDGDGAATERLANGGGGTT